MPRSKKRGKAKSDGGPYLASAVFCDSVLAGDDGAMTVVRIVDHITISIPANAPPDVPSDEHRLLAQISALVSFKKGQSRRNKFDVRLVTHSPSGKSQEMGKFKITFKGDQHGGANIRIKLGIAVMGGGLFWTDVLLDGMLMTRMPLLITVNRVESDLRAAAASSRGLKAAK